MIYSLRLQILLSMVAVILITVGMTAFMAGQAANAEIERVQGRDDTLRNRRLGHLLAQQYAERRSWLEAQGLLDGAGAMYGQRVVLTNSEGVVVADTHRVMMGRRLNTRIASRVTFPISGPEGYIGTVMVNPDLPSRPPSATVAPAEPPGPPLNVLLVLSGLLAVAVALVLTFFLSRRVVAPVESLAKAAHLVAQGDFSIRAEVGSRDEVGELASRFNVMVGELERTEELRRNMVADLAHELRTPLTNIRGYIEGISDGVITPDPETLESMQGEVVLLTRLIEDLQDLALAESGRLQLQNKECDLSQLVRNAVTAFQQQAQVKGSRCGWMPRPRWFSRATRAVSARSSAIYCPTLSRIPLPRVKWPSGRVSTAMRQCWWSGTTVRESQPKTCLTCLSGFTGLISPVPGTPAVSALV